MSRWFAFSEYLRALSKMYSRCEWAGGREGGVRGRVGSTALLETL